MKGISHEIRIDQDARTFISFSKFVTGIAKILPLACFSDSTLVNILRSYPIPSAKNYKGIPYPLTHGKRGLGTLQAYISQKC
jgi:hypothetical protein